MASDSPYSAWAWVTPSEIEERLRKQGDEKVWNGIKAMFGIGEQEQ